MTDTPTPKVKSVMERIQIRLAPPGTYYDEDGYTSQWLCELRVDDKVWMSGFGESDVAAVIMLAQTLAITDVYEYDRELEKARKLVQGADSQPVPEERVIHERPI